LKISCQWPVVSRQFLNKGCGYPWSDGACSGVQAIPALTAIFASIYEGLRWFWVLGALLSNTPLRRQSTAARSFDFAQDFACGFPLRSRPQSGSSSQWPASSWLSVPSSKRRAWNFFRDAFRLHGLAKFSGFLRQARNGRCGEIPGALRQAQVHVSPARVIVMSLPTRTT